MACFGATPPVVPMIFLIHSSCPNIFSYPLDPSQNLKISRKHATQCQKRCFGPKIFLFIHFPSQLNKFSYPPLVRKHVMQGKKYSCNIIMLYKCFLYCGENNMSFQGGNRIFCVFVHPDKLYSPICQS